MIFVNLPVADLPRAKSFYEALGFTNNPHFSDETSAAMVWSETINVMLLTHDKWRTFTNRPIPPSTSSEMMLAISCDSREAVDRINDAADSTVSQMAVASSGDRTYVADAVIPDFLEDRLGLLRERLCSVGFSAG